MSLCSFCKWAVFLVRPIKFPLANWISGGKWQLLVGRRSDVKALFFSGCSTVTALSPRPWGQSHNNKVLCCENAVQPPADFDTLLPRLDSESTDRCIRGSRLPEFMMHFYFPFPRTNTGPPFFFLFFFPFFPHCDFISLVIELWNLRPKVWSDLDCHGR